MRRTFGVLIVGTLSIATTPDPFGGWAVVTMQEMPEYVEVGTPVTLRFKIRQHGRTLLDDRSPAIVVRNTNGNLLSRFRSREKVGARQGSERDIYLATFTPRNAGEVAITIETDVNGWKTKLLPLRVVPNGNQPDALPPVDRGRQLFAAKGCATCHAMREDPAFANWQVIRMGPELANRAFPEEFLVQKLIDPTSIPAPVRPSGDFMPQLTLDDREIQALVAYLNHLKTATD